jgi:hypothetical protein
MADTQWCFWLKTILTKLKRGQFSSRFLNRRNAFVAQKIENIIPQKSNYNFSSLNLFASGKFLTKRRFLHTSVCGDISPTIY